jgi:hypothetical protein
MNIVLQLLGRVLCCLERPPVTHIQPADPEENILGDIRAVIANTLQMPGG